MSERLRQVLDRFDREVHDGFRLSPASAEEATALVYGLCRRAAVTALAASEPSPGMIEGVTDAMVSMLLKLRAERTH